MLQRTIIVFFTQLVFITPKISRERYQNDQDDETS